MAGTGCRYRIGYALSPKKVETFIQPSLLNLAQDRGIELVPIQLDTPLLDQGPFNCLIHKLSHPNWIHQLEQFLSQNPEVVIIDPPDAVHCLHNRITMLQVINQLQIAQLGVPNQVFVEDDSHCLLASKGVEFPVIAKPLAANGSAGSHQMSLVFNEEGLRGLGLNPPFILQEFVNHGGVIFKVYVAGRHVQCVKRKSLPDIGGTSDDVLTFSQISNLSAQVMEAVELPPADFVNQVAAQLRQALKLNLFNFDMIRDSRIHGKYLVIDINYFPGYAKIPNYETILTDFFLDVVEKDFEPV